MGVLSKLIGGYFETQEHATAVGFLYNLDALGGAVAPFLVSLFAEEKQTGYAIGSVTFAVGFLLLFLIWFDLPSRIQKMVSPQQMRRYDTIDGLPLVGTQLLFKRKQKKIISSTLS